MISFLVAFYFAIYDGGCKVFDRGIRGRFVVKPEAYGVWDKLRTREEFVLPLPDTVFGVFVKGFVYPAFETVPIEPIERNTVWECQPDKCESPFDYMEIDGLSILLWVKIFEFHLQALSPLGDKAIMVPFVVPHKRYKYSHVEKNDFVFSRPTRKLCVCPATVGLLPV